MARLIANATAQGAGDSTYQDDFFTPHNHDFYSNVQYNDLDPKKQEIRLLDLLPVEDDQPIHNIINQFVLSHALLSAERCFLHSENFGHSSSIRS